ncbi:biotin--[acetyl-CoA-carboxylase] ligase [Ramlibacter sp. H39-3-26]|uniref:biotin--[acetyl-CoA-carboxylase] ligase n=1 Tax=Curvibacter soli TaxID=3031331 RepID=UPI0023DC8417|nr:biotin--[acetyl-CoA-carboxylase] ligase [Ramlibacter sp. H39-3-26]MDF1483914.1 biotin--[acetyl-CoA-carboxylase] ligase [Ramlibacter sp. H39-3-26]
MQKWPAEAIWEAVEPTLPGFTVETLAEIDSTNTELMRRARAGRAEPTLLVAERQSAGRGRLGRSWLGEPGDALTFSLGLPLAPVDWSGLSLAAGVAVAEALQGPPAPAAALRLGLKWPNDLWLWSGAQGRKLAGILVETATAAGAEAAAMRYAVIGVGINVRPHPAAGLSTPPAALQEVLPGIDAPAALLRVAAPLVMAVLGFAATGFGPFQARFDALDILRDRAVRLSDGTTGTAHGVGEDGALLVHTAAGMQAVTSAEVSVRPAP